MPSVAPTTVPAARTTGPVAPPGPGDPASRWVPAPGCPGQPVAVPPPLTPRQRRHLRWARRARPAWVARLVRRVVPVPPVFVHPEPLSAASCGCADCLAQLVAALPAPAGLLDELLDAVLAARVGAAAGVWVLASWPALAPDTTGTNAAVLAAVPTARWLVQREQVLAAGHPGWSLLFLDAERRHGVSAMVRWPADELAALAAATPEHVELAWVEDAAPVAVELCEQFLASLGAAATVAAVRAALAPTAPTDT